MVPAGPGGRSCIMASPGRASPGRASPGRKMSTNSSGKRSVEFLEKVKKTKGSFLSKMGNNPSIKAGIGTIKTATKQAGRRVSMKMLSDRVIIGRRISKMTQSLKRGSLIGDNQPSAREMRLTRNFAVESGGVMQQLLMKEVTPMMVMEMKTFLDQKTVPRSSDLLTRHLQKSDYVIFVSHRWWSAKSPDNGYGLKQGILSRAIEAVVKEGDLDPATVVVWMDYFSIDQDDKNLMTKGIQSLIAYSARAHVLLIPVHPDTKAVNAFIHAKHPTDLLNYGERAWCRLENYVFLCIAEMTGQEMNCFAYGLHDCSEKQKKKLAMIDEQDAAEGIMKECLADQIQMAKARDAEMSFLARTGTRRYKDKDRPSASQHVASILRRPSVIAHSLRKTFAHGGELVFSEEVVRTGKETVRSCFSRKVYNRERLKRLGVESQDETKSKAERTSFSQQAKMRLQAMATAMSSTGSVQQYERGVAGNIGAFFGRTHLPSEGSLSVENDRDIVYALEEDIRRAYCILAVRQAIEKIDKTENKDEGKKEQSDGATPLPNSVPNSSSIRSSSSLKDDMIREEEEEGKGDGSRSSVPGVSMANPAVDRLRTGSGRSSGRLSSVGSGALPKLMKSVNSMAQMVGGGKRDSKKGGDVVLGLGGKQLKTVGDVEFLVHILKGRSTKNMRMSQGLQSPYPNITMLFLQENQIGADGVRVLVRDFLCSPAGKNVKRLNLSGNKEIGNDGVAYFADFFAWTSQQVGRNKGDLTELFLDSCGIGEEGIVSISGWIPDAKRLRLLSLGGQYKETENVTMGMAENDIAEQPIVDLIGEVKKSNPQLKLVLNPNALGELSKQAFQAMVDETLNLL